VERKSYGKFHSGDSYILLQVSGLANGMNGFAHREEGTAPLLSYIQVDMAAG